MKRSVDHDILQQTDNKHVHISRQQARAYKLCICVNGIGFASFYDFSIKFLNRSDNVVFFAFHFILVEKKNLKMFMWNQASMTPSLDPSIRFLFQDSRNH